MFPIILRTCCRNTNIRCYAQRSIISVRCYATQSTNPKPKNEANRFKKIWNKIFGKYLLTTNIVSSGILMTMGDVLSQEIEHRKRNSTEPYDWMRIGRMFAVGSIQGPLHHFFYSWMDKKMPVPTLRTTYWKIFLDQVVMSPMCILLFFYPACLLERKSFEQSTNEILSKFVLVYTVDWCVWPAVQFLNFHYLHPKYRVIYVNLITLVYNVFLSYVKHVPEIEVEN